MAAKDYRPLLEVSDAIQLAAMIAAAPSVSGIRLAEISLPIDPGQQAVGLRPAMGQPLGHAQDVGPPEAISAGLPPARQVTQVVVVSPLMMVAQVSSGVAIFGTAGGRAITP